MDWGNEPGEQGGAAGRVAWRRIAGDLEAAIGEARLAAGERLPTEMELARRYGVNRHTVRRALADLASQGHIKAVRGRGTFVADEPISYPLRARTRFSEIVAGQDLTPGGRVISTIEEKADRPIADHLAIDLGAPVLRAETLRVVNTRPVVVSSNWFPLQRVPDLLFDYAETGSISAALQRAGFADYRRKSSWVRAISAEPSDAEHLRLVQGAPLLLVESLNVSAQGVPLQFARARFAANAVELVVES